MKDIISKIEKEGILGRSGSNFPVHLKWESVKKEKAEKKYVVCNAAEGELGAFKDLFILKNHSRYVIEGIRVAIDYLSAEKGYIYLKKEYFEEVHDLLKEEIGNDEIEIVKKKGGYIGGEETALIKVIEGGVPEPQKKPPFPTQKGLWGYPTLVNNVESFYCVGKIKREEYEKERFYSIFGDAPNKGVHKLQGGITIREILESTGNVPDFEYFLKIGGGACGIIMLPEELDVPLRRLGVIMIYKKEGLDCYALMKKWVDFLLEGNCDKCTPCREGLYRIMEMIEKRDMEGVEDMLFAMEKTSFCPLGTSAATSLRSFLEKVLKNDHENKN